MTSRTLSTLGVCHTAASSDTGKRGPLLRFFVSFIEELTQTQALEQFNLKKNPQRRRASNLSSCPEEEDRGEKEKRHEAVKV